MKSSQGALESIAGFFKNHTLVKLKEIEERRAKEERKD